MSIGCCVAVSEQVYSWTGCKLFAHHHHLFPKGCDMPTEIITALIGLMGIIIGAIPTYLFMRQKGTAEIDKLKAETDKTKAEAEKIRAELQASTPRVNETRQERLLPNFGVHANLKLEEHLETAKTVDLLGYNLRSLLQTNREPIANAVERGTTVRIILVDIQSPIAQTFKTHSNRPHLLISDWVTGLEDIREIQRLLEKKPKIGGRFEVKITDWIPSCNLILINANESYGIASVGVHSVVFRQPVSGRFSFVLERKHDTTAFDFFVKGYDMLWNEDSKTWDGSIPQMSTT
jgi:hypothetical protein